MERELGARRGAPVEGGENTVSGDLRHRARDQRSNSTAFPLPTHRTQLVEPSSSIYRTRLSGAYCKEVHNPRVRLGSQYAPEGLLRPRRSDSRRFENIQLLIRFRWTLQGTSLLQQAVTHRIVNSTAWLPAISPLGIRMRAARTVTGRSHAHLQRDKCIATTACASRMDAEPTGERLDPSS